ncbi:hypothetical protein O3P69_020063 [Scylla paramamosain]|uniref:BTB domain-containing protein n=1 Tax=Scylla paramamosain TaxID=85552 RepID=A0AAW0TJP8_SCYPA
MAEALLNQSLTGQEEEREADEGRREEERSPDEGRGAREEERQDEGRRGEVERRAVGEERRGTEEERREVHGEARQPGEGRGAGGEEEERRADEGREGVEEERQPDDGRREEEEELEIEDEDDYEEEEEEREAEDREADDEREREEELQLQQQNRGGERLRDVVDGRGALETLGEAPRRMIDREDRMYWAEEHEMSQVARLTGKDWWQCHLGTVKQRMATLHHHSRLYDVVLCFPKYQVEMKAHKLVLAMSSPVLEAMLFGPMSQDADGRPHYLTLAQDLPETFEWLLRYLYRDETKFQGTVQALSVYEAAHKYQIDALARLCSHYLADSVTPDNFPFVFDPAVLHEDAELLNRCYEVAAVQGREVLSCPDLCVLRRPALRALLTLPRLSVDKESYVFRALVQWGWYHLDEGPPPPAKPCPELLPARRRLRAIIDEFLPYVRFLAMDLNEFVNEVEGSQLLSPDECMAVVRALRGIAPAPVLPHFISADATRRRKGLVTVAVLISPPSNEPLTFEYLEILSINLMQNLTVSTAVHLVRLASTGVCSLREGSVVVWDEGGDHVARGVWSGNGCLFRRPVSLAVGRRYSAVLTLKEAWCVLTTTTINVTHKRIVFRGQTQCGGRLRLEYMSGAFLPPPSLQRRLPASVCLIDS